MRHLYLSNVPDAFLERVKASKLRVLGDELVQPHKAVPGGPGRILAYELMPPFASEYALVTANTSDDGLDAALRHVLGLENHPRGVSMAGWLSRVMGTDVTEVTEGDVPAFR